MDKFKILFNHASNFESGDEFCKFNIMWISFNCFYNRDLFINEEKKDFDGYRIGIIKGINSIENEKYRNAYKTIPDSLKQEYSNFIRNRDTDNGGKGVYNIQKNETSCMENYLDFKGFVEVVYTIRNNQFHGGKNPEKILDITLIANTNLIFKKFLNNLYCNN